MEASDSQSGVTRWSTAAAWCVLGLALALRLQGLSFGLDRHDIDQAVFNNHLDERGMVEAVQKNFLRGNLDPGSFLFRGPAGFLLFGAVDLALVAGLGLTRAGGFDEARAALEANPSLLFLSHRLVNALAGVATVWLLWRVARREWGERAGLAAALFLATGYAHARDSHYGTVDVLWALFGAWTLAEMLAWWRAPRERGHAWRVGLGLGLATAFKYHGVLLVLPLLVTAWSVGGGSPLRAAQAALRAALVALATFLALFPGLFVAPETFRSIVGFQLATNTAAAGIADPLGSLVFHLRHSFATGLGEPVFVLAALGAGLAWRLGGSARALALATLLLSPLLYATAAHPVRYAMGLMPLLAALAGLCFAQLTARVPRALVALALLALVAPSLVRVVSLNRLLPRRDTRVEMLAELRARGLAPADVLAVGTHHGLPNSARRGERLFTSYVNLLLGDKLERGKLRIEEEFEARLAEILAAPPRLVLWDLTRANLRMPGKERLAELVRSRYREVLRLDGRTGDFPLPELEDDGGGHMIPFARPWTMTRPGTPLVLYERID